MTLSTILLSLYRTYHIDACFIADHLHLPDETVVSWEEGKAFPDEEQTKKLSAMFAVPLKTLDEAIKEGKRHETEKNSDDSGL